MRFKVLTMAVALATAASSVQARQADRGEQLFQSTCAGCHELALAVSQRNTPERWRAVIDDMANRGAPGSDDDLAEVRDYLLRVHGRIEVNRLSAEILARDLKLPHAQAEAIVARRAQTPIRNYEDLIQISGVEASRLAPYRQSLVF